VDVACHKGHIASSWRRCPDTGWCMPFMFPCSPLCRLIVAIFQRLAGLSMGLLEVGLLKFYQWVVDTAPPESWSVRTFTYLATGPFRCGLICVGPDSDKGLFRHGSRLHRSWAGFWLRLLAALCQCNH
jgi:hypothetical protein